MKNFEYKCKRCKDIWEFTPEDYDHKSDYPKVCPLCSMPITQMISDVYKQEGIREVIRFMFIRIFK
jgi:formate dehydrogenase maturation protein FdhE